jgi:DNA-binding response OmpR family regulator
LIAEQLERPLDLLISDVNLPGSDGRRLTLEIALLHPQAKVLYLSGMPRSSLDELGVLGGGDFLEKPFELNDFVRRVRDALGR